MDLVWDNLQLFNFFFTVELLFAIIAAANSPAFIAPSSPIARVPTGIPLGIWTIDNKLSRPFSFLLSTGTPITGTVVKEAIIPGKWADPPAPAIITE